VLAVLHPHVGTMVDNPSDVDGACRFADQAVPACLMRNDPCIAPSSDASPTHLKDVTPDRARSAGD